MSDHDDGQVDTSGARIYDEFFVPALFGRFAADLASAARVEPHDAVIDVACGTGALTREIRTTTDGRVVGVDLNPGMLAVARGHGGDIEYTEGDALDLPAGPAEFDVAVSQFGVMFLDDPAGGLREMARVASRGMVAVWAAIEDTDYPAVQELFRANLGDAAAASLDAPFAMGAPGVLENLCRDAGVEADFATVPGTGRFASIAEWVTTEVRGWTLGESVSDGDLRDLISVAERDLARFVTDDGCVFGMAARVATW